MAKAAILEKPGEGLKIGEVTLGDPAPHEVLIDTKACGLCHSDLHFIEGTYPHPLPAIPGHEAAGVVRAVGSEVTTVKPGDHVVSCLSAFCGHCEFCVTGRMALVPWRRDAPRPERHTAHPGGGRRRDEPDAEPLRLLRADADPRTCLRRHRPRHAARPGGGDRLRGDDGGGHDLQRVQRGARRKRGRDRLRRASGWPPSMPHGLRGRAW